MQDLVEYEFNLEDVDPMADHHHTLVTLTDQIARMEALMDERHRTDTLRHEERHTEVIRRITSVEVQTTATNGRVRDLEVKDAVRTRLEDQERLFESQVKKDTAARGTRKRMWWGILLAAVLGGVVSLGLAVLNLVAGS